MNILLLAFAAIQSYLLWQLWRTSDEHAAKIRLLETRQPVKPEPKAAPTPARQIFEKPIVPGAKEVQPLPIGGGRLKFDNENQVAEWV